MRWLVGHKEGQHWHTSAGSVSAVQATMQDRQCALHERLSRSNIAAAVQSCVPDKGGCSRAQPSRAQPSPADAHLTAIQVQVGLTIQAGPGDGDMVPLAIG